MDNGQRGAGSRGQTWKGVESRGDGGHHGGFAVAAEGVLEDARELGVPVGDVRAHAAGVRQRRYHVAQRAQALVDLLALLQPLACGGEAESLSEVVLRDRPSSNTLQYVRRKVVP